MCEKKCEIPGCGKILKRTDAKYCSGCSYLFYNYTHQRRFKNAKVEVIEKAVAERIKIKGRRNAGGQRPKYLKVREAISEPGSSIQIPVMIGKVQPPRELAITVR